MLCSNAYAIINLEIRGVGNKHPMLRVKLKPKFGRQGGYTIIESLIFLAVSGSMVIAVITLIASQQGRTQFQQAVREFEVKLQDMANDISTGNALVTVRSGEYCAIGPGAAAVAEIDSAIVPSATQRCIFVGRVLQFGGEQYTDYSLVGRQRIEAAGTTKETVNLSESRALIPESPYAPELKSIGAGIEVERMCYDDNVCNNLSAKKIGAFGFFTTFQNYDASDQISSGSIRVVAGALRDSTLGDNKATLRSKLNLAVDDPALLISNPSAGITMCLKSGTSNQKAKVVIGGAGSPTSITTVIGDSSIC